jgi:hypothetical protein
VLFGDAGTGDEAGINNTDSMLACRIVSVQGVPTPTCEAAGKGTDGADCSSSEMCAAGYDCVGAGHCQHYCCDGLCGKGMFCDIQPLVTSPSTKVPACVPVVSCKLLEHQCPSGETCAVVRADGATSCVPVGDAKVGDSCDESHCDEGLVCMGSPGARRCWQLCRISAPTTCGDAQGCKGGLPFFQDPDVGICQ